MSSKNTKSNCENCKEEFLYNKYTSKGRFCSNRCRGKFQSEILASANIELGLCSKTETLKKYLIREHGEHCTECGLGNMWNGKPIVLQVDHIDGNSDNNFPSNLRLLCANCHCQTETFCVRTKKNTKRNNYLRKYKNPGEKETKIKVSIDSCPECGRDKPKRDKTCSVICYKQYAIKTGKRIDWSKYDILELQKTMTNVAIGKMLGVSNVAVAKRAKKLLSQCSSKEIYEIC